VLLCCCVAVLLCCYDAVMLCCCVAVLLCCCISVLLYFCVAVLLCCCDAVLLCCCVAVLLCCRCYCTCWIWATSILKHPRNGMQDVDLGDDDREYEYVPNGERHPKRHRSEYVGFRFRSHPLFACVFVSLCVRFCYVVRSRALSLSLSSAGSPTERIAC
jgi:hypothetical protein